MYMKYIDVLDNFKSKIETYLINNGGNYSSLENVVDKSITLDELLSSEAMELQNQLNDLQQAQNVYAKATGSKSQDLIKAQKKTDLEYTKKISEYNSLRQKYNINGNQSIESILNEVKSADVTLNSLNNFVDAYENLKSCVPQEIDLLLNSTTKATKNRAKAKSVNYLQREYKFSNDEAADLKDICNRHGIQSKQFEEYFKKGFTAIDVKQFYDTFIHNKDVGLSRKQLEKFQTEYGFDYDDVNKICEARRKLLQSDRDIKLSRFATMAEYVGSDFTHLIDAINGASQRTLDCIYDRIANQRKPGMVKAMDEIKKLYP